jgi:TrmH family RNA methyltransferase
MTDTTKRQIREIAALQKAGVRREKKRFLIEGSLCVEEALHAGFPLEQVWLTAGFQESESGEHIQEVCRANLVHMEQVPSRILQRISSQEHSQGVLAVGKCREGSGEWANSDEDILIVIPRLSDPGNLGTIFRTAHAFDIATIWVGDGAVDPWHPKVVRGSMGALFYLNIRRIPSVIDEMLDLKQQGVDIWALDSSGHTSPDALRRSAKTAIVLGHEAEGIPSDILDICHQRIVLGRPGAGVGSLNVSVAAGILLFLCRFVLQPHS